jgi:hypothetical protein
MVTAFWIALFGFAWLVGRRMRSFSCVHSDAARGYVPTHRTLDLMAIHYTAFVVTWVGLIGFVIDLIRAYPDDAGYGLIGMAAGLLPGMIAARLITTRLEQPYNRWLERRVRRFSPDMLTDARTIAASLPQAVPFDHADYCRPDAIFLARDIKGKAITVPLDVWRKTHLELIGATGCGKSSLASAVLTQGVFLNHSIYCIDPKGDLWTPSVLQAACEAHGVPFTYVDLTAPWPQMNLLHGITARDLESLFIEGFDLDRQHDKYDYFRIFERMAADVTAQVAVAHQPASIADCARAVLPMIQAANLDKDRALGFIYSLRELNRITAFGTRSGARLHEPLARGGVFYVRGALEHEATINAQKMLLLRIMQIVRARPHTSSRHVTVFADDVRFVAGKAATRMLTTIRDRDCNLILAHTSLADLEREREVVTDNTGLKCCFRAHSPDVAKYMSDLGGTIIARTRRVQAAPNSAGRELQGGANMQQEMERPLIDNNTALSLPDRVCVVYGLGPAQIGGTCPIEVERREQLITVAPKPASEGTQLMPGTAVLQ